MPSKRSSPAVPVVSLEAWQRLHEAAARFRALEPWKQMNDSAYLGVLDPVSDELYICNVMGKLGFFYAFGMYRGREGAKFCLRILKEKNSKPLPLEYGLLQDALMATFVAKRELDKVDLEVFRRVQWPVRGRGPANFAKFRSYRPHYLPWYIDQEEARLLTIGLSCMSSWYEYRTSGNLVVDATLSTLPCTEKESAGPKPAAAWRYVSRPWPAFPHPPDPPDESGAFRKVCAELANQKFDRVGHWELDVRPVPVPIMDEDRPYYVRAGLAVDRDSTFVFGVQLESPKVSASRHKIQLLLQAIRKNSFLPKSVAVRHGENCPTLNNVCKFLKIPLKTRPTLESLDHARESLIEFGTTGRFE